MHEHEKSQWFWEEQQRGDEMGEGNTGASTLPMCLGVVPRGHPHPILGDSARLALS
jgi:hypothetical protein